MSLLKDITRDNVWQVYVKLDSLDGWSGNQIFGFLLLAAIQFWLTHAYVNLAETGRIITLGFTGERREISQSQHYQGMATSAFLVWGTYPFYGMVATFNVFDVLFK